MKNFTYQIPTRFVFGRGTENEVGREVRALGGTKVLIHYGGGSAVRSGLIDRVKKALEAEGIAHVELGGVQPNPRVSFAREAVKQAIEFGADFSLAVGGGSVIDTAKALAHGVANPDTDIWKFWNREETSSAALPIGVVLTLAAAGSEMSDSAVLTNEETHVKRGLSTDLNRPVFAILNPVLTYTLPKYQIGCGVVDIMMHTMDRYFTLTEGNELTDVIAEGLLRTVIKNGTAALENPQNYDAMSELMWAGSLSHNGLTGLGAEKDFAVHQLGHELSARFDIAHGASLSAVWGAWAKYVRPQKPERFAQFAKNVWGIEETDIDTAGLAAIKRTVAFFKSLDMPTCFSEAAEIGVKTEEELQQMAYGCSYRNTRTIGSFKVCNMQDILEIYRMANK